MSILRGYLKSFFILDFAPLAPQTWGERVKSPPKLGDLGGLNVTNGTSQTTSKYLDKINLIFAEDR